MKGKNFSMNNTGKRKKSDFYETPYSLTRLLLEKEKLVGEILEPAVKMDTLETAVNGQLALDALNSIIKSLERAECSEVYCALSGLMKREDSLCHPKGRRLRRR